MFASGIGYNHLPSDTMPTMHFDAHQPIIDDLEARILTIRDSL
jgi:hypothetical protein